MYIKCNNCDGPDRVLIHLTTNDRYEIRYRYEEGLYLILPDKEIILREMDLWCMGRPKLSAYQVGYLYEDMLETITMMIKEDVNVIDIDEIESKLIEEKYYEEWVAKGYIEVDKNGHW